LGYNDCRAKEEMWRTRWEGYVGSKREVLGVEDGRERKGMGQFLHLPRAWKRKQNSEYL
jgi:hypothetical protein